MPIGAISFCEDFARIKPGGRLVSRPRAPLAERVMSDQKAAWDDDQALVASEGVGTGGKGHMVSGCRHSPVFQNVFAVLPVPLVALRCGNDASDGLMLAGVLHRQYEHVPVAASHPRKARWRIPQGALLQQPPEPTWQALPRASRLPCACAFDVAIPQNGSGMVKV